MADESRSGVDALVVGFGSIGSRHARLLTELGHTVAVVSGRDVPVPLRYDSVESALLAGAPDYVVIANATSDHAGVLRALAASEFGGTVLVEKPLVADRSELPERLPFTSFVGYNLRFHPLLMRLRTAVEGTRVLSVHAYVGQYLPDWRPGTDYRTSYSASRARGGGVLRDLSHELDYLTWLLEGWSSVVACGGRVSDLEIESDDTFGILLQSPRCSVVTLQMNYLDRVARRRVVVNTTESSFEVDLIAGTFEVDGHVEAAQVGRDDTYLDMHRAVLRGGDGLACTMDEGVRTVTLVEAIEASASSKRWVEA